MIKIGFFEVLMFEFVVKNGCAFVIGEEWEWGWWADAAEVRADGSMVASVLVVGVVGGGGGREVEGDIGMVGRESGCEGSVVCSAFAVSLDALHSEAAFEDVEEEG